ncbi:MAG: hypothetical protein J6P90_03085 [Rikenellaceae bacterium]|nr:hypothetical protein [Rikenellaceae bacterium]
MKKQLLILLFALTAYTASAQNDLKNQPMLPLPHKVENVTLKDVNNEPITLPFFGEKNIIFFYIDPDKHKQNEALTYYMERRNTCTGPNIEGFGILNLKDTMLPNALIRTMARKRTEKNKAIVLTDDNRTLARTWGLGDCNNCFALIVVSKQGELIYCKKGELTPKEQDEFFEFIEAYQ